MLLLEKCFVVGALLIVLIVHRNFGLAHVRLWALFGSYAGTIAYHAQLQLGLG